jgi:hypothetical protein
MLRRVWVPASWAAAASWPFWGPLFDGRVLFFRDVGVTYYPDLVFLERALAQGIWPLWHPGADAGAPFLAAYPVHLALVALAGARATLALSPWLHVLIAMVGAGALARRLSLGTAGRWTAGCAYALSGWMLGSVLYPVFLAASWLPLAVALAIDLFESPRPRVVAALAVVLALQVTTLGAEVIPQTAIVALALAPRPPTGKTALGLLGAAAIAGLLAAPALAGAVWMLSGTARGAGFGPQAALSYSASLPVLLEAVLPRFLGDPHTFSDLGYWGQPFFPAGSPFFLSLYVGPVVLLLAARAGARPRRLWALAAIGVLMAAGSHGPLGSVMAPAMRILRVPPKFFLLATLAFSLLAGYGVDRARRERWGPVALLPGFLFLVAALAAWRWPSTLVRALAIVVPEAAGPLARHVIAHAWPAELTLTGSLALGAGLALLRGGPPFALLAGLLAVLDLARVGGSLNPAASSGFYDLRPSVKSLVAGARAEGVYRWFSYGVALSGPLTWRPEVTRRNADVWLYYLDRQSLLPRTQVLDGLDGAFDVDRMGLAPRGSTLDVAEARPELFRSHHDRLRAANVRWVLSFAPLPEDLVSLRGEARFPELAEPLRLYELRDPLPRAYYVDRLEHALDHGAAAGGEARVVYEAVDPHTVRLRCRTPPGFVVVLDGYGDDWKAMDGATPVVVQPVAGRYRAVPTPGGERVITLSLVPAWRAPALAAMAVGAVIALALLVAPACVRIHRKTSTPVLDSTPGKRP